MQDPKPLIILGSARKNGDTRKLVDQVFSDTEYELIDLLDYTIYPYNYKEEYPEDDQFMGVAERMFDHQALVFATPVYWYSMSGQMKIFFDRMTDLIRSKAENRPRFKGRKMFLLAVSASDELPDGFELPFSETADYLDMEYGGAYFSPSYKMDNPPSGQSQFRQNIQRSVLA